MRKILLTLLILSATLSSCHHRPKKAIMTHPWANKTVGYVGDSMTDPNCYGNEITFYWQYLEKWLGIHSRIGAKSGKQWKDAADLARPLYHEHGQDIDAIIVFLGTNDFNAGTPIGEWYREEEGGTLVGNGDPIHKVKRMQRTLCLEDSTFKGRINRGMYVLKSWWPDKQIVLLTPMHRSAAVFSETNCQPDESYQNSCGEYLDAYVKAIKEAGNVWSVPVIDLNALSGINPFVEDQLRYYHDENYDILHLSSLGHQRIAKTLMQQLLTLPVELVDEPHR